MIMARPIERRAGFSGRVRTTKPTLRVRAKEKVQSFLAKLRGHSGRLRTKET